MTNVSISELKRNPSAVLLGADDYPIAVMNRNKTSGYIVGKDIFEKLISFLEDAEDKKAIESTDYSKGKSLEEVVKELNL